MALGVPGRAGRSWRVLSASNVLVVAVVGTAYLAGAELSWRLFGAGDIGLAFFPAAGVTFAAIVLTSPRRWPAMFAVIIAAELTSDLAHGLAARVALGYAIANAAEPLVGGLLFRRLQPSGPNMGQRAGLLSLLVAGCIAGPVVGAFIGGYTKSTASTVGWPDAALHWWAGDGLGVLAIGAAVLACRDVRWPRSLHRVGEIGAVFTAIAVGGLAVFWFWPAPPTFLVLPVLVFVALRYGPIGVTVASALTATAANISTAAGHGAFAQFDVSKPNQLVLTQLFLASTIATVWFLSIETAGRAAASAAQELERAARERAEATSALGRLSASLLARPTVNEVAQAAVDHLRERFVAPAAFRLTTGGASRTVPHRSTLPDAFADALSETGPDLERAGGTTPEGVISVVVPGGDGTSGDSGLLAVWRPHAPPFGAGDLADLDAIAQLVGQAVQRAQLYEAERDGRQALQHANETVERLLSQARVEAERLRESEQRFQSLSDDSPLLVWTADTDGRFLWANTTFCAYLGQSSHQLRGSNWRTWLHPDDADAFLSQLSKARTEALGGHALARVRRADGEWRWMESWANVRSDTVGATESFLGTSVDVTDRHRADQVLQSAAQLQELRLQLADAFAASQSTIDLHAHAADILGRHLGASRVHWADIDATETYGVVRAGYRDSAADSVIGFHRLSDHPPEVVADLRRGRPLVVEDVTTDPRVTPARGAVAQALGVGAYVIEPVVRGNRIVAALFVHRRERHTWDADELAAIAETTARTWAAVEDLRSVSAAQQVREREGLALRAIEEVNLGGDVATRLGRFIAVLAPLGDYVFVAQASDSEPGVVMAVAPPADGAREDNMPAGLLSDVVVAHSVERAVAEGVATLHRLITPAVRARHGVNGNNHSPQGAGAVRSLIAVPLDLGPTGAAALVIGLAAGSSARDPLEADDLGFIEQLAGRVTIALATARLQAVEHEAAVTLQKALLPDRTQHDPRLVIEARYHAASDVLEVGGDWYDTFRWPDGKIGVMVGDVVGHNLQSAAAMGRLRAATSALAGTVPAAPAGLLDALDRFAHGPDGTDYATAACVVVDPSTGDLSYSCAGHPPPIVVNPDGTTVRLTGAQSPPLGAVAMRSRRQGGLSLTPGTVVVLYSDGLVERRGIDLDAGIAGLERELRARLDQPIDGVADGIVASLPAGDVIDDVVVALFRFTPVVASLHVPIKADGSELAGLRATLRAWLSQRAISKDETDDVLLAIGEACTNSIDHAYRGQPGEIDVRIDDHAYHLAVSVSDHGTWRFPGPHSDGRGRGSTIMSKVASRVTTETGGSGTTVTFLVTTSSRRSSASLT